MAAISTESVVGVIGAGAMGAGIAQVAAQAGHTVLLTDSRAGAARTAIGAIAKALGGLVASAWGVTAPFWFAFAGSALILALIWRSLLQIAHADEQTRADAPPTGSDNSSTETGQGADPSGPAGGHDRLPAPGADAEC